MVAFVVQRDATPLDLDQLRTFLRDRLPEYMVPVVTTIAELPMTSNRKLDRAALAAMPIGSQARDDYEAPRTDTERRLAKMFASRSGVEVLPASELPADADVINISALGAPESISPIEALIAGEEHLVAYAGHAMEGAQYRWIDIHHSEASKGGAVETLRAQLGASKVLCFGDSDNDLSMFATADECFAPENAKASVKAAATAVIGHHDEDGIARYLRGRFNID